jgi:hypothetical protein
MTIAFSICSNNYLAQAKTLLGSLEIHHPEIKTFIFLVDELHESIDYSFFNPAEVIVVNDKIIPAFKKLVHRYNVLELNAAVRPFIFQYLATRYPQANRLYYLDPDIYLFERLDYLDKLLETEDLIITPHFLTPVPIDGLTPSENLALNYGTYNLGFLAINPSGNNVKNFLTWWGERTSQFCYIDVANGYFVDQIWFNLVPVLFRKVHILLHPGYNMACWNLHERVISQYLDDGKILLMSGDHLVFYHFSLWSFFRPKELTQKLTRFNFNNRPDLGKLFSDYYGQLQQNRMEEFSKIPCRLSYKRNKGRSGIKRILLPGVSLMKKVWQKL